MKKRMGVLLIILCLILMTGCDDTEQKELAKNLSDTIEMNDKDAKLVCTIDYDYEELGYVIGAKYIVFADEDNNVNKVTSHEIIESNDQDILDEFEDYYNKNHSAAMEYSGYEPKVSRTDNTVVSDVTIDYSQFNMEQFVSDNKDLGKEDVELTLDSIENQYVLLGAKCEKK